MQLNEYQLAAVRDESQACLVNANVGSGKTTVIIEKIAYLQKERKIEPARMIVLTFTNKAANEIRERLQEDTETFFWGTFHSVAMKLLQTLLPVEELQYTKEFQVCVPEEELELAMHLIAEYGFRIKYQNRLKKRMETWSTAKETKYDDDFEKLMKLYNQEKICRNKMSYSDLIQNAVILLQKHPEFQRPEWLIVDEVQDCDPLQIDFLDALKGEYTKFFAVGDPNQVIYGWRGSAFGVFYQLKSKYGAVEYSLPMNYRSSGTILKAAGRFLQNGNKLEGIKEEGEKIRISRHHDAFQEASYLAESIRELQNRGVPYGEISILYRLQKQSEIIGKVLELEGIPYETSEKSSLSDIPVISWILNVCRYLINETDSCALKSCITDIRYGDKITGKCLMKYLSQDEEKKIPLLLQIRELFENNVFSGELSREWILLVQDTIGIKKRIGLTSSTLEKEMEQIDVFFKRLLQYAKVQKEQNALQVLKQFLNETSLYGMNFQEEEKSERRDKVNLMTLHASKGLEFSHVFIIGVNKGLIPLGTTQKDEEEEMRLMFVGMTRAKEYLELSYYTGSTEPGVIPGPSPYLKMINSSLLNEPLKKRMDTEEAAIHLQKMKRMILKERTNQGNEEYIIETKKVPSKETETAKIRIRHDRYGEGFIMNEDENMVRICFDDYGEKEMLKAFTNFTIVSE